jgi:hypothetical protein
MMQTSRARKLILFLAVTFLLAVGFHAEEGMYPISEIHKLDLRAKGFELTAEEIFNPNGLSLVDAIVQVGGCTGSFISPDGLIITNHHCAYGAVQAASTAEKDYIQLGFLADRRSDEIEAKGVTARITESYRDVSQDVLRVVKEDMSFAERTKAIEQKMKAMVAEAEKQNPGKRAEVAEMFSGKTYVLFIYTYLRDIRLVYVPPRSIGEFGGETDNWMWPRHTGDFSFMRAYTAPDGSPAGYAAENVPYRPRKHLKIAVKGVDEGDFVFILGYPGRTYRHQTAAYLSFEAEVRMPFIADWYAWQIGVMEEMGRGDRELILRHLSRIKGLSNTMKNYRGKLQGLRRLDLVGKKRAEEIELQEFIDGDVRLKAEYGTVLKEIAEIYAEMRERAPYELFLSSLRRSVNMVSFGLGVYEAAIERQKPDLERESAYMDRNFDRTKQRIRLSRQNYYEGTDRAVFKELLMRAAGLEEGIRVGALEKILKQDDAESAIDDFLEKAYAGTSLDDEAVLMAGLEKNETEVKEMDDPFLKLAAALYPEYKKLEEVEDARKGRLDRLSALLVDVKMKFQAQDFIPDANRTLRLTFGRINGYRPRDAVYYRPLTTVDGVVEKTTGEAPFDTPQEVIELVRNRDFGRFVHSGLGSVPVCVLYDMDTSGGNSGSPILNARGELVGVNFDRAYEATVNDFAWSQDYSRSIGVDIRYVLWVTEKYGKVDHILNEIGLR